MGLQSALTMQRLHRTGRYSLTIIAVKRKMSRSSACLSGVFDSLAEAAANFELPFEV